MHQQLEDCITFPLFPVVDGKCGCDKGAACKKAGKHPRVFGWADLSEPLATLRGAGYGIQTGLRSDCVVVDIDNEKANEELEALGDLPPTFTVATGRGWHMYFQHPGFYVSNSASRLVPGVDVRGDGGFVVGPGSPHANGATYEVVEDVPLARLPDWLLEKLRPSRPLQTQDQFFEPTAIDVSVPEGKRRIALAEEWLAKEAEPAIEGEGGSEKLWAVALRLVRTWELPVDVAAELIETHYNDRCDPPWSAKEVFHKLEDARTHSSMPCGVLSPATIDKLTAASKHIERVEPTPRKKARTGPYTFTLGDRRNGDAAKASLAYVITTLRDSKFWEGVLQFDISKQQVRAVDCPFRMDAETVGISDTDITAICSWFEVVEDRLVSWDMCLKAVEAVARENSYHPVEEYLRDLEPMPVDEADAFLKGLATQLFGAEESIENVYLRKFLIGGVARALRPGVQMDTMLILQGPKGYKKTQFVISLFSPQHTVNQLPDLAKVDSSAQLQGAWGVEIGELDRLLRTELSTVKDYLSRRVDKYRPAYGRFVVEQPRRCCFIGTTNDDDFIRDPEGERRFWPIAVHRVIDTDWVEGNRDNIWRAALALYDAREPHYLSTEQEKELLEQQSRFIRRDAWEVLIEEWLLKNQKSKVTAEEVYKSAIIPTDIQGLAKAGSKEMMRVSQVLKSLGWEKKKREGKIIWVRKYSVEK